MSISIAPLNLSPGEKYRLPKVASHSATRRILRIESSPEYPSQHKKVASQRAKLEFVPVVPIVSSPEETPASTPKAKRKCLWIESSPEFPKQDKKAASQRAKLDFIPIVSSQEEPPVSSPEVKRKSPWIELSPKFSEESQRAIPIVSSQEEPACSPELFTRKKPKLPQPSVEVGLAPCPVSKEVTATTYQGSPLLGRKQASTSKSYQILSTLETESKTKDLLLWEPTTPEILEALERKDGTIEFHNGTYVGQLQELMAHGKGTWKSTHGDCYEGNWVNGEFHGEGTYRYANGNFYNGGWKEGKQDGQGIFLSHNGDSYEGEWKQGKMHGKGMGKYAKGDFYQGDWENNQHHGWGTFHFSCKGKYRSSYITFEGEYRNNKRHGEFIISTPQGSQCTLQFQDGKPIPGSSRLIKLSSNKHQYCIDRWI